MFDVGGVRKKNSPMMFDRKMNIVKAPITGR